MLVPAGQENPLLKLLSMGYIRHHGEETGGAAVQRATVERLGFAAAPRSTSTIFSTATSTDATAMTILSGYFASVDTYQHQEMECTTARGGDGSDGGTGIGHLQDRAFGEMSTGEQRRFLLDGHTYMIRRC
ncbi:MAG: hypothetical protein U0231_17375 [Nitrospiraceae bacterium]